MLISKGFKVEIRPSEQQIKYFESCIGAHTHIYNWALSRMIEHYKLEKKSISKTDLNMMFNIHKEDNPWLYDYDAWIYIAAMDDLDTAYKNFFRNVKKKKKGKKGFPQFHSRKRQDSFKVAYSNLRIGEGFVILSKVGLVRLKEKNYLPQGKYMNSVYSFMTREGKYAHVSSITISRHGCRWFASVQADVLVDDPIPSNKACGVKFGVWDNNLMVSFDGKELTKYPSPRALKNNSKKLARVQRKVSRKRFKKDMAIILNAIEDNGTKFSEIQSEGFKPKNLSNILCYMEKRRIIEKKGGKWYSLVDRPEVPIGKNILRWEERLRRIHYRITNIRRDNIHRSTTEIAENNDLIIINDLDVKKLMERDGPKGYYERKLQTMRARNMADASLGEVKRQLVYKAQWNGGRVFQHEKGYPSAQTCSVCGNVKEGEEKLDINDRSYKCASCGLLMDRDENSARLLARVAVGQTETLNACGDEGSGSQFKQLGVKPSQ